MARKADKEAQTAFVKEVQILSSQKDIDFWFYDESAAQGDPFPHPIWVPKGSRPIVPYMGQRIRTTMAGAVRPRDGYLFSLLLSTGNTDLFQVFINELHRHIANNKKNIMILDNASFHRTKALKWGKIEPLFLPPYSPVLNPIEELWLQIKREFFRQWCANDLQELEDRAAEALKYYMDNPNITKSVCAMSAYL